MGIYIEINASDTDPSKKSLVEVIGASIDNVNILSQDPPGLCICYMDSNVHGFLEPVKPTFIFPEDLSYDAFKKIVQHALKNPGYIPDMTKQNIPNLIKQFGAAPQGSPAKKPIKKLTRHFGSRRN